MAFEQDNPYAQFNEYQALDTSVQFNLSRIGGLTDSGMDWMVSSYEQVTNQPGYSSDTSELDDFLAEPEDYEAQAYDAMPSNTIWNYGNTTNYDSTASRYHNSSTGNSYTDTTNYYGSDYDYSY